MAKMFCFLVKTSCGHLAGQVCSLNLFLFLLLVLAKRSQPPGLIHQFGFQLTLLFYTLIK